MKTKEIIETLKTIVVETQQAKDYFAEGNFESDFDFNWQLCKIRDTSQKYHFLWQQLKNKAR